MFTFLCAYFSSSALFRSMGKKLLLKIYFYQSLNLCTLDELFHFKLGNHKSSTKLKNFHLNLYLKFSFPSQVDTLDREVQYFQVKLLLQVQEKILQDFLTIEDINFYYNLMISLFNRKFVRSWVGFKIANSTSHRT